MKKVNVMEMRNVEGGWTRCRICNKNVYGNWWSKYKHCLGHASRCLPWWEIMGVAFYIF